MGYTCIRPMKVQTASGEVEMRQPGDAVPEAETWANPGIWIKRGYIQADDAETARASGYMRERLLPAREATADDIKRGSGTLTAPPAAPEPPAEGGQADAGSDDPMAELLELTRADLDALAAEHGVDDPGKLANKKEVAKAIVAAQAEAEG